MKTRFAIFFGSGYAVKTDNLWDDSLPNYAILPVADEDSTFDTKELAIAEARRLGYVGFAINEVYF